MIRWICRSTVICLFIHSFIHSLLCFLKFEMLLGRLEPDGKRKVRKYDHFTLVEKWQFTSLCKISFHLSFINNHCSFCFVLAWLHWQVSQRYTKDNWACGQRFCREGSLWRGSQTLWSSQGTYNVYSCLYLFHHDFPFHHGFGAYFYHATFMYVNITESWKSIGNLEQALESGKLLHLYLQSLQLSNIS